MVKNRLRLYCSNTITMNGSESNSIVIDQNDGVSENVTEVYDTNMTSDNEETPMMQFLKQMRNYVSGQLLEYIN